MPGARPLCGNASAKYAQIAARSITTTPSCTIAGTFLLGWIAR
jgi:hypothetical protein